eukprot:1149553-Pelagomonas_calceolata.AAC.3
MGDPSSILGGKEQLTHMDDKSLQSSMLLTTVIHPSHTRTTKRNAQAHPCSSSTLWQCLCGAA